METLLPIIWYRVFSHVADQDGSAVNENESRRRTVREEKKGGIRLQQPVRNIRPVRFLQEGFVGWTKRDGAFDGENKEGSSLY